MPRPSPLFDEYKNLFVGMNYFVETENRFNCNTKIVITCKEGHTYTTSITKIKSLNQDYKTCPHCKKEQKYNKFRVPSEEIEKSLSGTSFELINKKEFYKKFGDNIEIKCKNDGNVEIIKSINYWIENGKKIPECSKCLLNPILSQIEYDKKINEITKSSTISVIEEPKAVYNAEISTSAMIKVNSHNWYIEEFNGTRKKSKFVCKTCGIKKEAMVFNLRNCLNCEKNNLKNGVKEKLKQICKENNIFITSEEVYKNLEQEINFKCNTCGGDFSDSWARITGKKYLLHCPICYNSQKRKSQNEIYGYIESIYKKEIIQNDRKIIPPKEIDIFLPENNIAFEYCGNIWHSEKYKKDKNYHYLKYKKCEEKSIKLITIFEDEWKHKNEITKSRIKSLLNLNEKTIFARKCIIKTVDRETANTFMDNNHLQGATNSDISIGLFFDDELVSLMCFRDVKGTQNNADWDLVRFANKLNVTVCGGASKLLNEFRKNHRSLKLSTYSDSRWCDGKFYENIGFSLVHEIDPGYYYVGAYTKWRLKHRFTFKKQRLMKIFNESDESQTEHEIALKNGLYRIYDCGHKKYELVC